jgi:hypothetical protein
MQPYLAFLIGIGVGLIVASAFWLWKRTYGTLVIDRSNPQKDVYRIEISDLDRLATKKSVVLKVDINNFSQE